MRVLLPLLTIIGVMSVSMVTSYLTGFVTIQVDASEQETVGMIRRSGFPIWFYENAAGISIMGGWKFDRFVANCSMWLAFFGITAVVRLWKTRKSRS